MTLSELILGPIPTLFLLLFLGRLLQSAHDSIRNVRCVRRWTVEKREAHHHRDLPFIVGGGVL